MSVKASLLLPVLLVLLRKCIVHKGPTAIAEMRGESPLFLERSADVHLSRSAATCSVVTNFFAFDSPPGVNHQH